MNYPSLFFKCYTGLWEKNSADKSSQGLQSLLITALWIKPLASCSNSLSRFNFFKEPQVKKTKTKQKTQGHWGNVLWNHVECCSFEVILFLMTKYLWKTRDIFFFLNFFSLLPTPLLPNSVFLLSTLLRFRGYRTISSISEYPWELKCIAISCL